MINPVYFRMALYVAAPLVGLLPGVTYDADAFTLLIDLEAAAVGLTASLVGVVAVFQRWGKK
jgi:hypothetical protein